jgi:hypothetical protein
MIGKSSTVLPAKKKMKRPYKRENICLENFLFNNIILCVIRLIKLKSFRPTKCFERQREASEESDVHLFMHLLCFLL